MCATVGPVYVDICANRSFLAKQVLEMCDLDMKFGDTIQIKGFIDPEADRFAINLGQEPTELALHFNPRFKDGARVIVFDTVRAGQWGTAAQLREKVFPFEKGAEFQVSITFHGDVFKIKMNDDPVLEFPNQISMDKITFLSVQGNVGVKTLQFDYDPPRCAKGSEGAGI